MSSNNLKILSLNCQSVISKKEVFWELLDNYSPDVVVACETWLNQSIANNEFISPNYKMYRLDRNDGYGGIFISVKSNFSSQLIQYGESCELCAVKLRLTGCASMIIIGAYRPPNRDITYMQYLCDTITDISIRCPHSFICCAGDFNVPDISWATESVSSYRYPLLINQALLKMSADCYFTQLVDFTTRDGNTLDLFFTNRPTFINSCLPVPGISDHDIVLVSLLAKIPKLCQPRRKTYLWNRANLGDMKHKFANLSEEFTNRYTVDTPVEDLWNSLCDILRSVLDEFVPSKLLSGSSKKPWINRIVKQLRRRKQKQYNLARLTNSESHWKRYKTLKKLMQKECRNAYNYYMDHTVYDPYHCGRKKKFFQHVKSLRRDISGIPTLEKDGVVYSTDTSKADVLNEHFFSIFTTDNSDVTPGLNGVPYPSMPDVEVDTAGIAKLLGNIDPFKATGSDGLPPKLLRELSIELAPCLTLLFKASLRQGSLPEDWKTALVTPIFKKGSRNDPSNYRPISLTSVCCKVFEHIIYSSVMFHLESFHIISDEQFGFRAKRSAELQLLRTIHDLSFNLDKKLQTDVILLDFCKAFDKVSHRLLLHKLDHYGIRGSTLKWISSFLHGRSQRVVCNGCTSSSVSVTSGVPQGTVLGPLLFLIYINDLPKCVSSHCALFADDCLLYRKINNKEDHQILQHDLHNLELWANKWLMSFNVSKCEVLRISLRNALEFSYILYNFPLHIVSEARYLGVIIDSKLNFNKHTDVICKKANSALSFLRRNLLSCNSKIKSDAYLMYVRPILEYAICSWSPHSRRNIDKLEAVQRRAARFVLGNYHYTSSVTEMLHSLKWSSISSRVNAFKLQMMYKIIHRIVDLKLPNYITFNSSFTRGHNYKLTVPPLRIDAYKFSFFPSTITLWNRLLVSTVNAATIDTFTDLIS